MNEKRIQVPVTPDELNTVDAAAKEAGFSSRANFVRWCIRQQGVNIALREWGGFARDQKSEN